MQAQTQNENISIYEKDNNSNENNMNLGKFSKNPQKKFCLPLQAIPFSLKNRKEFGVNKIEINKTLPEVIKNNFSKYTHKNKNGTLLEKIKEKVYKENFNNNLNQDKGKIDEERNNILRDKENINVHNKKNLRDINDGDFIDQSKKEEINSNNIGTNDNISDNNIIDVNKNKWNNKKNNNKNKGKFKDENNDDEENEEYEDYEEEEIEDEKSDNNNNINKVTSINIKSANFVNNKFNSDFNFSLSSNNSKKSILNTKCFTEPDEYSRSYHYDPPSGRSNNSGNSYITSFSSQGNKLGDKSIRPPDMKGTLFALSGNNINLNKSGYLNGLGMNSVLSTGANSCAYSGQRYDTSISGESGQSPNFMNNFHQNYNNYSGNSSGNNTPYLFSLNLPQVNPNVNVNPNIQNVQNMPNNPMVRHMYSCSYGCSNDFMYKQQYNINLPYYYKTNKNPLTMNQVKKGDHSNYVPSSKEKQFINLEDVALGKDTRTTIMIRNIPIKYNNKVLEQELEPFEGKYDCLYMPFDYEKGGNKGYAFLNLKNSYHVLLFYEYFQEKCWNYFESKKICELNFANFQGINEIKKHAKNYKGTKKPTFYINTNDDNKNKIEVPKKYLNLILQKHPKLKYIEKVGNKDIIEINSFN